MEFADFRRDDETFEKERKKYASKSQIMKDKVVIKEGKEGVRAKSLRLQGEDYVNYKRANDEMIDTWSLITVPKDAVHKVTEEEIVEQMSQSEKQLSIDLDNLRTDRKNSLKKMITNIVISFVFIVICIGLTIGILKLDEVVAINFENIYIVYGGYLLVHGGIPVLVFRLLRLAEGASMEHYIRAWHQIAYIGASLVASLLLFNYMTASIIGLVVWGISQLVVILLTILPKYEG